MQKAPSLVSCVVCKRFSTSHTSASQSKFWTPHNGHAGYLKEVMGSKEQDSTGTQRNFLHQIFHLLLLFCGFRCGSLGLFVAQPGLGATGCRVLCVIGSVSCHLHDDAGSTEQGAAAILPRAAFRGGYSVFFTNGPPGSHRQHHCVHQKHKGHQRCKGEQKQQDGQNQDARKGPRNRPHASGMTQTVEP